VVVEVETDKATVEVESPADGILRIVADEGAIVPVDGVLGELHGSDDSEGGPRSSEHPQAPARAVQPARADTPGAADGRPVASPAARRLASERGHRAGGGCRAAVSRRPHRVRDLAAAPPPAGGTGRGASGSGRPEHRRELAADSHVQIGGELAADGLKAARALVTPPGR